MREVLQSAFFARDKLLFYQGQENRVCDRQKQRLERVMNSQREPISELLLTTAASQILESAVFQCRKSTIFPEF